MSAVHLVVMVIHFSVAPLMEDLMSAPKGHSLVAGGRRMVRLTVRDLVTIWTVIPIARVTQ